MCRSARVRGAMGPASAGDGPAQAPCSPRGGGGGTATQGCPGAHTALPLVLSGLAPTLAASSWGVPKARPRGLGFQASARSSPGAASASSREPSVELRVTALPALPCWRF